MSLERRSQPGATDVLVVDDEEDIRELLELSLLRMGLGAETVGTLAEAIERIDSVKYRLCLTDMRLPDGDGLTLVEYIQRHHPGLPSAVITAYGNIETAIRALKLGAFDFVTKPIELATLKGLVEHALNLEKTDDGAEESSHETTERSLIGSSQAMAQLRGQIKKLSRNQAPIFIHGESGVGKEVIAHLIHSMGARADAPFVPVNCGAIPPELMESEFFGHCKGSFTGATTDKDGLFQAASGGTLFLDEVAELPLPMQVKLLRAIQERAVRPVGAQTEMSVDVRILSASHRDLAQLVANNHFRQDLYFRINVIALRAPPLREHLEDIPDLAAHLLVRLAERDGCAVHTLKPEALFALQHYAFPGNVRELENLLERACALSDGPEIGVDDLGFSEGAGVPLSRSPALGPPADETKEVTENERDHVLAALEATHWNRSAAARKLGMTLRQLRYRLEKWGMD